MSYRAVIFDLDGTLLDTLQDLADTTNTALIRLGFPTHETEAYKMLVGEGREALALRSLPEDHRDRATLEKAVAIINAEYSLHWADNTRPYPGIPQLLDALTARKMMMAVLSNKAHEFTDLMVAQMLSSWRFDMVLGALPSLPRKPDPAGALQVAQRLNVPPSQFLYLGDSGIDMETAARAGMYPVGALWGFRSAEELLGSGAKALIQAPEELLRLLDEG